MLAGTVRPEWTTARLVNDDPAKTLSAVDATELQLVPKLQEAFGQPVKSLDLISPYFVPGDTGTEALSALVKRGVRVRVLTNSLASTDVKSVQAGYVKYRDALLRAGVQLFELKPDARSIGAAPPRSAAARRPGCTPRPTPSMAARSSSARSTLTRARPS